MLSNTPETWKEYSLVDVALINYGTRIVKNSALGNKYYVYGGGDRTFMTNDYNRENTLVVARFGMSPKCTRFIEDKFFLNDSGLTVESKNENVVNQEFLNWQLYFLNDYIYSLGKGVAQKNLNVQLFKKIKIVVPILIEEQQEIVDVLDTMSDIIRLREECISHAQNLIPALFQEMFGDVIQNKKNINKIKLGEIFVLSSGKFLPAKEMDENGVYPVYGGNGINGHHNEYLFNEPQLCIGRVGVKCGCIHLTEPKSWITDNALYVNKLLKPINKTYLKEALTQINLNQYAKRAAQPVISQSTIYNQYIIEPTLELQEQFAQKAIEIESYIKEQQEELENAKQMFQSLLHQAFTGELTKHKYGEVNE